MTVTQELPTQVRNLIFINYRRDDASGYAGRLYDRLSKRFGEERVFRDIENIPPGAPFANFIKEKLASCAAVLVVIGTEWLTCTDEDGRRRLDDPADLLRIEVALALSDKGTRVIPLLVKRANMPREEDLPDELKPLAQLNGLEVSDKHFKAVTRQLIDQLRKLLPPEDHPPPPPGLIERLKGYWELFPVRLIAGVLLLSAVLIPQMRLAYRPEPVNLEATGLFSPAAVKFGGEMLTIVSPVADEEGMLLAHVANPNEVVDLAFESARLEGNSLMLFSEQNPPTGASRVSFLTKLDSPATGEPCRTFLQLRATDATKPPPALHFYQHGAPGGDIMRDLRFKADGAVSVGMDTVMADGSEETSPGCEKLLRIAPGFETPVGGDSTLDFIADPASAVSFSFSPVSTTKEPLFASTGGLFQPFSFGSNGLLRARAVEIVTAGAPASVLAVSSDGDPLSIESLSVGSDRLEVRVSGVGMVTVGGKVLTDPLGRINRHPLVSLLLFVADAALLAWVIHLLFGRRRPHGSSSALSHSGDARTVEPSET